MRKMKGVSPIIAIILIIVITLGLAGVAQVYIRGIFAARSAVIELIDSYCENGNGAAVIRNSGITTISSGSIVVIKTTGDVCTNELNDTDFAADLPPGGTLTGDFTGCPSGVHKWRIRGPSNVVEVVVIC